MRCNNKTAVSRNTRLLSATLLLIASNLAWSDTLHIAVASNFVHTLRILASNFERSTGHETRISSASTGKLYAQIVHGAPYDVYLAADEKHPDLLIASHRGSTDLASIYAVGKLTLLSNIKPGGECQRILDSPLLKRLAIANPDIAPYGKAARQVLEKSGHWDQLADKRVTGENIAQTLQFVSTGNATAGFVARSMLLYIPDNNSSCTWPVPAEMHSPINQKMVVLRKPGENPAIMDFWNYMQSDEARHIISNNGYDVLEPMRPEQE